ncbi:hypothetical protein [Caballeronia hypogeia]|uniref:hypothetical protein n=1 Tax=Caballeronia hypogeia TaxID=1777140 RepID=UPI000772CB9E|nr:hypothetical protein [Caballeronia hypogeia]
MRIRNRRLLRHAKSGGAASASSRCPGAATYQAASTPMPLIAPVPILAIIALAEATLAYCWLA